MEKIKIEDLRNELYLGDYGEDFINYKEGYICDIITEIADNNVPIYNSEIWSQAVENSNYIEEALQEFGTPTDNNGQVDLIKIFQQGLYYKNEQDVYENLEEILKNWMYNYIEYDLKIKELTDQENENLLNYDFTDHNSTLEDLVEHIEESLKGEE